MAVWPGSTALSTGRSSASAMNCDGRRVPRPRDLRRGCSPRARPSPGSWRRRKAAAPRPAGRRMWRMARHGARATGRSAPASASGWESGRRRDRSGRRAGTGVPWRGARSGPTRRRCRAVHHRCPRPPRSAGQDAARRRRRDCPRAAPSATAPGRTTAPQTLRQGVLFRGEARQMAGAPQLFVQDLSGRTLVRRADRGPQVRHQPARTRAKAIGLGHIWAVRQQAQDRPERLWERRASARRVVSRSLPSRYGHAVARTYSSIESAGSATQRRKATSGRTSGRAKKSAGVRVRTGTPRMLSDRTSGSISALAARQHGHVARRDARGERAATPVATPCCFGFRSGICCESHRLRTARSPGGDLRRIQAGDVGPRAVVDQASWPRR